MRYAYYQSLSRSDQKIYRASDNIHRIKLNAASLIQPLVRDMEAALMTGIVLSVELVTQDLLDVLVADLKTVKVRVHVLDQRPSSQSGELYGLYEPVTQVRAYGRIMLWMRTAKRAKVVAFKTYLRTLLHEFCHHLDYEYFKLEDSYHTQGFFRRETSLYRQLTDGVLLD